MLRVFFSWSRDSRPVASALADWLPLVINAVRPWISEDDIEKGSRSMRALDDALAHIDFGIVCVTPRNNGAPWLNFESGALAKDLNNSRVVPFLVGLKPSQITGPLSNFQATEATFDDMWRLVTTLNSSLDDEERVHPSRLQKAFERFWPDLEEALAEIEPTILSDSDPLNATGRPPESVLEDLFGATKQIQRDVAQLVLGLSKAASTPHIAPSRSNSGDHGNSITFGDRTGFPGLETLLEGVIEVNIVGKSLAGFMKSGAAAIESAVQSGCSLNAALLDPRQPDLMDVASRTLYATPDAESLISDIEQSLEALAALANTTGRVEVRLLSTIPSFSMVAYRRKSGVSTVGVELYPFRVTAPRRPSFSIPDSDPWYAFFADQFVALWGAGSVLPAK